MLKNSNPEYWNLFVNNLLWFKQCICLWKQLVFYCYTDFSAEKENNLWLMLAVVSYAALCVFKSPSYYGMSSYTVQEMKRQGDLQILVSDRIFLWNWPFSLAWNAFVWMGPAERLREDPRNNRSHLCSLASILKLLKTRATQVLESGFKHHCTLWPPLHPVASIASLPYPASAKSLRPLIHPCFLQSFQQDLTCGGSIGMHLAPPVLAPWLEPIRVSGELSWWTGPWLGC